MGQGECKRKIRRQLQLRFLNILRGVARYALFGAAQFKMSIAPAKGVSAKNGFFL